MSFSVDRFIATLHTTVQELDSQQHIPQILKETVADYQNLSTQLPDYPENDTLLYEDSSLSVWHVRFIPGITVPPHEHRMPAFIGVYQGQERNDFYKTTADNKLINSGQQTLGPGDILAMSAGAIHSVSCVSDEPCCGLHVYLGELSIIERSLFHPDTHERVPFTEENYALLQQTV